MRIKTTLLRDFVKQINCKLLLFTLYNLTYVLYMIGLIGRYVNLSLLFIFVLVNSIDLLRKTKGVLRKTELSFWSQTQGMLFSFFVFAMISVVVQVVHGSIQISYLSSYVHLLLPLIATFVWANTTDANNQMAYFYVFLARFVLNFLINNIGQLSISAISTISFSDSMSSAFESSDAHCFFILMIIFLHRKKRWPAIISGLFCMLCFKRLCFVLTPIVFFTYHLWAQKKPSKAFINILKFGFSLSPFIVLFIINNADMLSDTIGIDIDLFASGRLSIIRYVMNNLETYNGFGTISAFLQQQPWGTYISVSQMHCDLLQIFLETSLIGVVVYIWNLFEIGKYDLVRCFLVLYFAFELLTSHFMDVLAVWLLLYMFCASLDCEEKKREVIA